jgi:pilus assembly protein CpaB
MKPARIIVLGVALLAGGLAFMLSGRTRAPAPVQAAKPAMETVQVLVAKKEIALGKAVQPGDLGWQAWPADSASAHLLQKKSRPNAVEAFKRAIARSPFIAGEPIREQKLIRANGSGFMSAILSPGMRAVSTDISPETGVGGFVLPNDHVDVLLTHRDQEQQKSGGSDGFTSETVLRNVRVLAIDQTVQEKDGQKVVVGKTATLELSPREAETLVLSRQRGKLSLALRPLTETKATPKPEVDDERNSGSINFVRYGVNSVQTIK